MNILLIANYAVVIIILYKCLNCYVAVLLSCVVLSNTVSVDNYGGCLCSIVIFILVQGTLVVVEAKPAYTIYSMSSQL